MPEITILDQIALISSLRDATRYGYKDLLSIILATSKSQKVLSDVLDTLMDLAKKGIGDPVVIPVDPTDQSE